MSELVPWARNQFHDPMSRLAAAIALVALMLFACIAALIVLERVGRGDPGPLMFGVAFLAVFLSVLAAFLSARLRDKAHLRK